MQAVENNRAISAHLKHSTISSSVAAELLFASNTCDKFQRIELRALASRIILCNHKSNAYFVPKAYERLDGSYSDTTGRFWRCHSKLCQWCLAKTAARTRAKVREALAAQQLRPGERYYFATLTIPNFGLPLLKARAIINDAWCLLRKRSLSVSLIRGGFKSEEFTYTASGYHYHTHHIWLSSFMNYQAMREEWTSCAAQAFKDHGLEALWQEQQSRRLQQWNKFHADDPCSLAKPDLNLIIRIERINDIEGAIQEVCKYITKADSWTKISPADLASIGMVHSWHRMTEFYGSFAPARREGQLNRKDRSEASERSSEPILDTAPLNDGASPSQTPAWRQMCHLIDLEMYLINLEADMDNARHWGLRQLQQRFPHTSVIPFDCL